MSDLPVKSTLDNEHLDELLRAKLLLENPSLAARISSAIGSPIEKGIDLLPDGARETILDATKKSLDAALKVALYSLKDGHAEASNRTHKATAALSGAAGGVFGLSALAIELPVSTTIMLRSIADIARSEGELLQARETQLACLEVFALSGKKGGDDAAETGYFGVRAALASAVSDALKYTVSTGAANQAAPALIRLIKQIAARFSIPVTQKAAAQAVPVIGAVGGALINTLFIDHFQDIARGHFVVRRLERNYGTDLVRAAYRDLQEPPSPIADD